MANIYNEKAWLKYSQMPNKEPKEPAEIQKNLEFLDQKLELAQKQLSVFDFYQIKTYVDNNENYQSAVDNLEPNTSLVCTESFITNNETFSRGDIIYKYENGSIEHIRAERAGIYAPSALKSNEGNYKIIYHYYSYEPTQENSTADEEGNAEFAKNITFPVEVVASKSIYNIQTSPVSSPDSNVGFNVSFNIVYDDGTPITPFVRFYTSDGEEVYWEYTLVAEPEDKPLQYKIIKIPTIVTTVLIK